MKKTLVSTMAAMAALVVLVPLSADAGGCRTSYRSQGYHSGIHYAASYRHPRPVVRYCRPAPVVRYRHVPVVRYRHVPVVRYRNVPVVRYSHYAPSYGYHSRGYRRCR